MAKFETLSVKVPPEMKKKIKKYNIKTSQVLRTALAEEIRRKEIEELENELDSMQDVLDRMKEQDVVKLIREDRDTR